MQIIKYKNYIRNFYIAYQLCVNNVIHLLKIKYPNKDWNATKKHEMIFDEICDYIGLKGLCFDEEICIKLYDYVYKGLTTVNFIAPLMDIDIDPSLRQFNEYDKDYDECIIEEQDNNYKFNLI